MRLLNAQTYQFYHAEDSSHHPRYAILSHTWGDKELTYADVQGPDGPAKMKSDTKIAGCCERAVEQNIDYVWIDTICIDKSSSTELSEAINSMGKWYWDAYMCYAYLSDIVHSPCSGVDATPKPPTHSRWFTRSWTLQELLSPNEVMFYDCRWILLGFKLGGDSMGRRPVRQAPGLSAQISALTGIPEKYILSRYIVSSASVAQRMSWAAERKATRKEDVAYSLMGLFGVRMPMLYGEGDNAFIRLQQEIMRITDDESIFAWGYELARRNTEGGVFASSPADFARCGGVETVPLHQSWTESPLSHYSMTNKGLFFERPIVKLPGPFETYLLPLDCSLEPLPDQEPSRASAPTKIFALPLTCTAGKTDILRMTESSRPVLVDPCYFRKVKTWRRVYITKKLGWTKHAIPGQAMHIGLGFRVRSKKMLLPKELISNPEVYPTSWTPMFLPSMLYPSFASQIITSVDPQAPVVPTRLSQDAYFRLSGSEGGDYILWLKYKFSHFTNTMYRPVNLDVQVQQLPSDLAETSLAELILRSEGRRLSGYGTDWKTYSDDGFLALSVDNFYNGMLLIELMVGRLSDP